MQDVPLARTPDFYSYPDCPPSEVVDSRDRVVVRWSDGVSLDAYGLWLFENQMGNVTVEERTRESMIDPADFPDPILIASVSLAANGDVVVVFDNGRISAYHSGWLRHVAEGQHRPPALLPELEVWTADRFREPQTHHGPEVLADDDAMLAFLSDVTRFGLARLEGLATTKELLADLGGRIGALRDTNFGVTWPVSVDLKPTSTANTSLPLPPHSDLPTRETPPGFQLLHCLVNTCGGGLSTMADGYAVVQYLQDHEPEHYEALTTLNWVFFNRSPQHDHRWSGPIIDATTPGAPLTLRAFHPVRGFPDMPIADQPRAYAALRAFSQLGGSDAFQIRYPFRPGDLVMFDNRRILHGRTAIDANGGRRELHGTYIDHDEVYSRLRVLTRHRPTRTLGPN